MPPFVVVAVVVFVLALLRGYAVLPAAVVALALGLLAAGVAWFVRSRLEG